MTIKTPKNAIRAIKKHQVRFKNLTSFKTHEFYQILESAHLDVNFSKLPSVIRDIESYRSEIDSKKGLLKCSELDIYQSLEITYDPIYFIARWEVNLEVISEFFQQEFVHSFIEAHFYNLNAISKIMFNKEFHKLSPTSCDRISAIIECYSFSLKNNQNIDQEELFVFMTEVFECPSLFINYKPSRHFNINFADDYTITSQDFFCQADFKIQFSNNRTYLILRRLKCFATLPKELKQQLIVIFFQWMASKLSGESLKVIIGSQEYFSKEDDIFDTFVKVAAVKDSIFILVKHNYL